MEKTCCLRASGFYNIQELHYLLLETSFDVGVNIIYTLSRWIPTLCKVTHYYHPRAVSERLMQEAVLLFDNVVDDFHEARLIMSKFERWKHEQSDSYEEAYIGLCLPKLFTPLVRLKLVDWNPLEVTSLLYFIVRLSHLEATHCRDYTADYASVALFGSSCLEIEGYIGVLNHQTMSLPICICAQDCEAAPAEDIGYTIMRITRSYGKCWTTEF